MELLNLDEIKKIIKDNLTFFFTFLFLCGSATGWLYVAGLSWKLDIPILFFMELEDLFFSWIKETKLAFTITIYWLFLSLIYFAFVYTRKSKINLTDKKDLTKLIIKSSLITATLLITIILIALIYEPPSSTFSLIFLSLINFIVLYAFFYFFGESISLIIIKLEQVIVNPLPIKIVKTSLIVYLISIILGLPVLGGYNNILVQENFFKIHFKKSFADSSIFSSKKHQLVFSTSSNYIFYNKNDDKTFVISRDAVIFLKQVKPPPQTSP
jgi:hypothetical protein